MLASLSDKPIYRHMTAYLDANATEPPREAALAALLDAARLTGNPASVHGPGRAARRALEEARRDIGGVFGIDADHVVFTSGGTEANALAVHAFGQGRRILIGATEHDAIRSAAPHAEIVPVRADGQLCLEALEQMLSKDSDALVCIMAANNETGILHPLPEIKELCRRCNVLLHVDAVQGAGRLPFDLDGITSAAISGHKFGGIKGAGALLLRESGHIEPLLRGGGQERGRRGGTPALPAIVAMAAALKEAQHQNWESIASWRDRIDQAARQAGARIAGQSIAPRLPNTTSLILDGVSAQTQLMVLDLAGYAVSAGSACSSGKVTQSHVLAAMGLGEAAGQAVRVSLPWNVTAAEVDGFIAAYTTMAARLGKRRA